METPDNSPIDSPEDPETELVKIKNSEIIQNLTARAIYTKQLFILLCVWLAAVLLIVYFNPISKLPGTLLKFNLSDPVLITIITTTTANIAAFFLVVTKYLFPENRPQPRPEKISPPVFNR